MRRADGQESEAPQNVLPENGKVGTSTSLIRYPGSCDYLLPGHGGPKLTGVGTIEPTYQLKVLRLTPAGLRLTQPVLLKSMHSNVVMTPDGTRCIRILMSDNPRPALPQGTLHVSEFGC